MGPGVPTILYFLGAMTDKASQTTIQVNGETTVCPQNISLVNLLELLGFNPRLIAIEYNGEIIHRQYWPNTTIHEGDRLEIVTIVGGG